MVDSIRGGWGVAPWGRAPWGNAHNDIPAGYEASTPINHKVSVPRDQVIRCTTYAATSWIDLDNLSIEISEDNGVTYNSALDVGESFVSPYDGTLSKVYREDSHRLVVVFQKSSLWVAATRVVIRAIAVDEHGVVLVQAPEILWGAPV